jgi:hypothetical protein
MRYFAPNCIYFHYAVSWRSRPARFTIIMQLVKRVALWSACITLFASVVLSLSVLSFWMATHDLFEYNATGEILSVESCIYGTSTWSRHSYGTITVQFKLLSWDDNSTAVEMDIHTPDICSSQSCCSRLVGETLYFSVSYSDSNGYRVHDFSEYAVQHRDLWYVGGGLGLVIAIATILGAVGCLAGIEYRERYKAKEDEISLVNREPETEPIDVD